MFDDLVTAEPLRSDGEAFSLVSRLRLGPHAGAKAPHDVRAFAGAWGWRTIDTDLSTGTRLIRGVRAVRDLLKLFWIFQRSGRATCFIVQYPLGQPGDRALGAISKAKSVALVHDVESIRYGTPVDAELKVLAKFDVLIVHSPRMRELLEPLLPSQMRFVELGMFDYLTSSDVQLPDPAVRPEVLYIVGNLAKDRAAYVYDIQNAEVPVLAYGPNCQSDQLPACVEWHGLVAMNAPELATRNGFGLVWDGTSAAGLKGHFGEYIKVNSPHKLSMYVAAGVPVIVPEESPIGDLVRELGIGYTAQSISHATFLVRTCTANDWAAFVSKTSELREKVKSGWHTWTAVNAAVRAK